MGDMAATIAIATLIEEVSCLSRALPLFRIAEDIVRAADFRVRSILNGRGLTTLSIILSSADRNETIAANVGDSRIYSWPRNGQNIHQVTIDDTLDNELRNILPGNDSMLDARGLRGALSPAIGETNRSSNDLNVGLYGKEHFLDSGVLLATDGAWKVDELGFKALASNATTANDVVRRIVAVANWVGGVDNVSVIAIEDLNKFALSSVDIDRKNSESSWVTAWAHDTKFTIKEPVKISSLQKISVEYKSPSKKSSNETKKSKRKPLDSPQSLSEATSQPQLELIASPNKQQKNSNNQTKQHQTKVKVQISTDND
jgi:serine/threonine protein phosphatase PrpC